MWQQVLLTIRSALRDRILHAVLGVGAFLLLMVPVLSSFSMRQVQETSIGLALSASSLVLLVLSVQLGSSAIFRDIDRRYINAVLTLPISRTKYLVGRYLGLALFLFLCSSVLVLCSVSVILYSASTYTSPLPIVWSNLLIAFAADVFKFLLLTSIAVFFSSLSTSFSLPFFCTLAVYLAGSASQEVFEYISGSLGETLPDALLIVSKAAYYAIPNFSAFDFHIHAVYGLPLATSDFLSSALYGACYIAFVIWASTWAFNRRELP
jgi:ABC-type transport system involved in multi-copper enzyme maturation permease subunit